jgi:hypothetical protein
MTSAATQAALNEIKSAVAAGQTMIAPVIFSHCFGRAATSAAFRMAKAQGLIEVAYMSCVNTPVYRAAGIAQAIEDAKTAPKH